VSIHAIGWTSRGQPNSVKSRTLSVSGLEVALALREEGARMLTMPAAMRSFPAVVSG
jgi:hypothetical protein